MMRTNFLGRGRTLPSTATAGDRRVHRVAPAWLVGAIAVAFVTGGVLVAGGENPAQRQSVIIPRSSQTTQVTGIATTNVNVHAVPAGQTRFDLASTVVGTIPAGSQVALTCQFGGTDAGGAGNQWYQATGVSGVTVPAGEVAVVSATYLRTDRASVPTCGAAPQNSGDSVADAGGPQVNPDWTIANDIAFGGKHATGDDQWRDYGAGTAGTTSDDGIVLFRLFIPDVQAAGRLLRGDNRGFDPSPQASSRGIVAWNTRTGDVSLTVTHSELAAPLPQFIQYRPALRIADGTDMDTAFAARDQIRYDNRFGVDPSAATNSTLHARVSLLNPLTNGVTFGEMVTASAVLTDGLTLPAVALSLVPSIGQQHGAWSVDFDLTISRRGPGDYALDMTGNGYPA
ncbi:hypothetical protein, partial [Actinophytocola sp.]|uniref:hypothetical protein n=1 Tax=Actinophytocola sp. TaxID=1872138 RepID=UPI00389ABD9D